jgi:hypothetical protein
MVLTGCKKTQVNGSVLSKHNIPVPNAQVIIAEFNGYGHNTRTVNTVKTDESGKFTFDFHARRNHSYRVICSCDSGVAGEDVKPKQVNYIDLHEH